MATIADYLRQQRVQEQPDIENLIRNLGSYSRNRQVLQALGQPDASAPKRGLGSSIMNVLGAPGRLVQASLLQAAGVDLPETRGMSTGEVLGAALRGDVDTSASRFGGLRTTKEDPLVERIAKGVGAFGVDVLTDPLSYVTAPSSISRKAAASQLFRSASKVDFIDNILSQSNKGAALVDDVFERSVLGRAAAADTAAGLTPETSKVLADVAKKGKKGVVAEEVASELAGLLQTDGRQAVVRRLEDLTGSKSAALSIFKSLPDEVRGGIVLASPITGKPLIKKSGEYARLTSGATFGGGKIGEALNTTRLAMSVVPGNAVTRWFSGQGGEILADLKKARLLEKAGKEVPEKIKPTRFIDYITFRDELTKRGALRNEMGSALLNAQANYIHMISSVGDGERDLAEKTARKFFFAPAQAFDASTATDAEIIGYKAAKELRTKMNNLRQEAIDAGIDIGEAGLPDQYSPLMLTPAGREQYERVGIIGLNGKFYAPEKGRDSFVQYIPDPEEAAKFGYVDPSNPGVVYLNAQSINDQLEQAALKAGKNAEAAKAARVFEEDPTVIMSRYGTNITNAIANKRFIDGLTATGTVLRAPGQVERVLAERQAMTAVAGIAELAPDAKAAAQRQLARIDKELADLTDVKKLDEVRTRIATTRTQLTDTANIARRRVNDLSRQVMEASAEVAEAAPAIGQIRRQLSTYAQGVQESTEELAARQRAARNVRARLKTAERNLEEATTAEEFIAPLEAGAVGGFEQAYYRELGLQAGSKARTVRESMQAELDLQARLAQELEEIKGFRKAAREGGSKEVEQAVYAYEQSVTKRNRLINELATARSQRDMAVQAASRVEKRIGLEQVDNLNALVRNFVQASAQARKVKAASVITEGMTPEIAAAVTGQVKVMEARAKEAMDLLRKTLSVGRSEFAEIAGQYADEIIKVANRLSDEQLQALTVLTDQEQLLSYINAVRTSAGDNETMMRAMGDIWRTFVDLREIIPDSSFAKLEAAQRSLLKSSDLGRAISGTVRERGKPSELAYGLADRGYSVINANQATKDLYAASGVLNLMREAYKVLEDPTGWQRALNAYLDPILLSWRNSVTVGRGPGYLANNVAGGMFMNYIGNVSVADHKLAAKAIYRVKDMINKIEKANPDLPFSEIMLRSEDAVRAELNKTVINGVGLGDLFSSFTRLGGFESTETAATARRVLQAGTAIDTAAFGRKGQQRLSFAEPPQTAAEAAFRRTTEFLMTNRVQAAFNDWTQTSELFLRFPAFIDGFRRYGDEMAAMDKVYMLHFNYQDLTSAEVWVRRFLPFYTWMRNNIPAQIRAMVLQPGKIQRALYANEEFKNTFGAQGDESWLNQVLPEYIASSDGFASQFKFGDNNIGLSLKLPFEDINKMFYVDGKIPKIRGRELLGSTGLLTTPIELLSGRDLQTGAEFNPLGEEVPGYYNILRPLGLASTGPEGETRATAALARGLGDILPQLGTIERLAGSISGLTGLPSFGLSSQNQRDKALATALNLSGVSGIAGLSAATLTPKSISAELRRRQSVQSADIKRAAAELDVDVDWLRKQLQEGRTPEEISMLIRAGQGKLSGETKEKTRDSKTLERYRKLVEGL